MQNFHNEIRISNYRFLSLSFSIKMEVGIEDCLHIEFEYNKSKYASFIYISLTSGTTCMNRNRVPLLMCRKHNIKLKVHCQYCKWFYDWMRFLQLKNFVFVNVSCDLLHFFSLTIFHSFILIVWLEHKDNVIIMLLYTSCGTWREVLLINSFLKCS